VKILYSQSKIISKELDDKFALEEMKYENERKYLTRFGIDLAKEIKEWEKQNER